MPVTLPSRPSRAADPTTALLGPVAVAAGLERAVGARPAPAVVLGIALGGSAVVADVEA